jgi:hypothetical protein
VGGDTDTQHLLNRLTELGERIAHDPQSPLSWRYQLEQADTLLRLALRSRTEERDNFLHLAIDSYYSASLQSPGNEQAAHQLLAQLPTWISQVYPGHPLTTYAVLQEIHADYQMVLAQHGDQPALAQQHLRDRLMQFAQTYPKAPEAPKAVMDAGQVCEAMGKVAEARQCYHYLSEHFAGHALARKAGGALWRLGLEGEPLHLNLPPLFASEGTAPFDLSEMHGKLVVVHCWSSADTHAADDFELLKNVAYRYEPRGVEVIHVNMDAKAAQARGFLEARLTAGTHLYQPGGKEGAFAEHYGIETLPQIFLVGQDGCMIKHSIQATQIEAEINARLPRER